MATGTNYDHTDEKPMGGEFTCSICKNLFNDPVCTPCDHTFCRKCIKDSVHTGNIGCPVCGQQVLSMNSLAMANRSVRNMLDRL